MSETVLRNLRLLVLLCIGYMGCLSHAQNSGQEPIAFTLGQDDTITFAPGSTLSFNKVITSLGPSNYFNFPGVFTSPADGIYKFQVYAMSRDNRILLELYKNQELVASLFGFSSNNFATTGNAVILYLKQGDEVSVQSDSVYDITLYGHLGQIYNTFSGVRLVTESGTDTVIAFSATLISRKIIPPGATILYDKLLLNQGDGYYSVTGVFTAPVPGVYIFHFFSLSEINESISQDLYHNNEYICSLSGLTPDNEAEAGNTVILHLKSGDHVQVKSQQTNKLFGGSNQIFSTFSGALIGDDTVLSSGSKGVVAFSAGLSRSITEIANTTVVFNRIFTNLQHAYDQRTGYFTAPIQGVYEFIVHIKGQSTRSAFLVLYHNSRIIMTVFAVNPIQQGNVQEQHGIAGNSVIIHLLVGDSVYLDTGNNLDNAMYGRHDQVHCTFSGYLIAPTYNPLPIVG